jgi:hypothetical protein
VLEMAVVCLDEKSVISQKEFCSIKLDVLRQRIDISHLSSQMLPLQPVVLTTWHTALLEKLPQHHG